MALSDISAVERLDELRDSHRMLRGLVEQLPADGPAAASMLPGWNRAEVVTHVCRNADALSGLLEAALRNELVPMYPGGLEGRAADIATGRDAGVSQLLADFDHSTSRLEGLWDDLDTEVWERPVLVRSGQKPAWITIRLRWQETEIHACDLGTGRGLDAVPAALADELARVAAPSIPERLDLGDRGLEVRHPGLPDGRQLFGPADGAVVVDGPPDQILSWLLGRTASGLSATVAGEPADTPVLGPWL